MTEGKISTKAFENLARASIAQDETIDSLRAELAAVTAERDALRAKVDAVPAAESVELFLREFVTNSGDGVKITYIPPDGSMYGAFFSVKLYDGDKHREGQGDTLPGAINAVLSVK